MYRSSPNPDIHALLQTDAIVSKLMRNFVGKGHTVYADNFHSYVKLKFMIPNQRHIQHIAKQQKSKSKDVITKKFEKEKSNGKEINLI